MAHLQGERLSWLAKESYEMDNPFSVRLGFLESNRTSEKNQSQYPTPGAGQLTSDLTPEQFFNLGFFG